MTREPLRFTPPRDHGQLRHGGRWQRLLLALEVGPLTVGRLLEETDNGRYPVWRERRKIRAALEDMADAGFVVASRGGWTRTAAGDVALSELLTQPANAVRTPGPERA